MQTFEAMQLRRSIRKFRPEPVPGHLLKQIVNIARLYPSGGNLQPVRFAIVTKPELTGSIFADLGWAMYLPDYAVAECEQPTAYIILLLDTSVRKKCDYDIGAASTMAMLAATDLGLATCPLANFNASKIVSMLNLPETLRPELVIALGYPAQESCVIPMDDTVRYSQDENGNFLVPKWNAEKILAFTDTTQEEIQ